MSLTNQGIVQLPVRGRNEAAALITVVRQLARAQSEEEVLAVARHGVRRLLGADGAILALRDGERGYYAEEDAISPLWAGRRFSLKAGLPGWCMAHGQSVYIPDIREDARVTVDAFRPTFVRSLAMAPVGLDEPIAALGAYWSEARQPQPEDLATLQAIADAAALAVAKGRLEQSARPVQGPSTPQPAAMTREPAPEPAPDPAPYPAAIASFRRGGFLRSTLRACGLAVVSVVIATLARLAVQVSGVEDLAVFSTYYPAVLVSMLIGGKRAGILAAALGGLAAHYFFMPPLYEFVPLHLSDVVNLLLYGGACGVLILVMDGYQRAVQRLRQGDAQHLTLAREQQHRARNALAVVETIIRQSLRDDPVRAGLISQRIRAGFAEVDIHVRSRPSRISVLLTHELEAFDLSKFAFKGDEGVVVPPEVSRLLSLAVHELATNAVKYGALSVEDGRVVIGWRVVAGRLTLSWREFRGPPVQAPSRRGYGSIMLHRLIDAAGGEFTLDFRPAGVWGEISLDLKPARPR